MICQIIFYLFITLFVLGILVHSLIRIIRQFYKFPIPHWMASWIDNPLRHQIQDPETLVTDHGIRPEMRVLEIGPGKGTYTIAAARRLGPTGRLVALDIQKEVLDQLQRNLDESQIVNIYSLVADVHHLPFPEASFDLIRMIAVIDEIPHQTGMFREYRRVLTDSGLLACSELLLDPDYPLAKNLIRRVQNAGFQLLEKTGNIIRYTVRFQKTT